MLFHALLLGFLFAFLVYLTLKIFFFSSFREKFTEVKLAEFLKKNEALREAIDIIFKSLSIEKIAEEKIRLIIAAIKRELAIPPVFFLPTLEEKIVAKSLVEVEKLAFELKQKASEEADNLLFYQTILKKVFSFFNSSYLWVITLAAFVIGFFLGFIEQGIIKLFE